MTSPTVLLVEDDEDELELARLAFQEAGLAAPDIAVARDGLEALAMLAGLRASEDGTAPLLPAVVLVDLNLPRLHGLGLIERIRATPATRRLPIVVLTSSREESDRRRSYDLGANSYIRKPVDFDQFVAAARQIAQYWTALNEPPPFVEEP